MIKRNQIVKGVTFANLSYGADSHVEIGNIKLTLPQSELYLNANNYKSAVFIGGRGAGKSYLGKKFLEDTNGTNVVTILPSYLQIEEYRNLHATNLAYHLCHYFKHLRGYSSDHIIHLVEPFSNGTDYDNELDYFDRIFVECTVPQLNKNNELHRWFTNLVGKDSTLTVIGNTCTNFQNLGINLRQLVTSYSANSVNIDGI
jgi:hypothetical protein